VSYFERMEEELVAAAARFSGTEADDVRTTRANHHPRAARKRFVWGAVAASIASVIVATVLVGGSDRVEASAVTVHRTTSGAVITVTHRDAAPSDVVTDIEDAGIRALRVAVTTGPSQVGRLFGLDVARGAGIRTKGPYQVAVPPHWTGQISVVAGVRADAGDQYEWPTDAFATGEPLACLSPRVRVSEVARRASAVGAQLTWQGLDGTTLASPPSEAAVTSVSAISSTSLVAHVDGSAQGVAGTC
jgi:hypothetical protein